MQIFRRPLISLILIMLAFVAEAQHRDSIPRGLWQERYPALLIGLSAGSYVNGEIGFAKITSKRVGVEPVTCGWFASDEIKFANKLLMAPKIGFWKGNGLGLGLNNNRNPYPSRIISGSKVDR